MASYILGLSIGMICGMCIYRWGQRFNTALLLKSLKKEIYRAYEEGVKFGAVRLKIERINEISQEQVAYISNLDRPNASAAHARHKNTVVSTIKQLEEEKLELFRSILKDGADPTLTVNIDGTIKQMKASELLPLLESGNIPQAETPQSKTDSNSPGSATHKLRVVKSTQENKDDRSNPSDPAVH